MRNLRILLLPLLGALALCGAPTALAGGGDYVFDGGSGAQRQQVTRALEASAFDWNLVPARITIHISGGSGSFALPGHIWLDGNLLAAGRFSWAVVQDEYAHQVDYFLLDGTKRARLARELGASAWCYETAGLRHSDYGCERFSSMLAWAYWPSADNAYRPTSRTDESASMDPGRFRALLTELVGAPTAVAQRSLAAAKKPAAKLKQTPKR